MGIQSDNLRYRDLKVREGEYVPDVGTDYPENDPLARLVPAPKVRELVFDDTYPFIEDTLSFKLQRALAYFLVFGPFYLVNKLKFGVRTEGRKNLFKYRKHFRNGIVSVSNHCYRWDGMAIAEAMHHRLWIPMLPDHFEGPDWWYLKYFGGIPLPDGSFGAQKKFNGAFDVHNSRREWIHVFPEARNWNYYKPVRPFKKGAFTMAYKYNVPILPIGLTYRERTGIHKFFAKQEIPLITVKIGEPIFPDVTKSRKSETDRLLQEAHTAVCKLTGIENNTWPAVWNNEV